MQHVSHMPHSRRALAIPLAAAVLGAGVATTTFALVNIEDQPILSSPAPAAQSAPSNGSAALRYDGGPQEGAAQQNIRPEPVRSGASSSANVPGTRYDGGPEEGTRGVTPQQPAAQPSGSDTFGARP
jgi:hypothetical protein